MNVDFLNPRVLAYMGDAVFEVLTKEYLIKETKIAKLNDYQKASIKFLSAFAHQRFILNALENNWLSEREIDIYKRARNTKTNKNDTVEHNYSTGFEAIIGALYLENNKERIDEIFDLFVKQI